MARPRRGTGSVEIQMPTEGEIARMFDAVPILERYNVADKVTKEASKPILARAKSLVPVGKEENRQKRSKNQWTNKSGVRINWDILLSKTLGQKFLKYQSGRGVRIIGHKWPDGNKANFFGEHGNKGYLWGKTGNKYTRQGREYTAPQNKPRSHVRNWIVQAFDETRQLQNSAMKAKLKELMDEIWRSR